MAKRFILRNNTVEMLFGNRDTEYAGYDDISFVPTDADTIVWCYQVPIKYETDMLVAEVDSYLGKLQLVHGQLPADKRMVVFTLVDLYSVQFSNGDFRLARAIMAFNQGVYDLAETHPNVKVIDMALFLSRYPAEEWIDWKYYFISQQIFNPRLAPAFKRWFDRRMEEIDLQRKKCIVLDLDNTLWGGILGEDGIEGIKIGGDYPGKAFLYFQEALAELSRQGIILAICSKNNEADVLEAWDKNPFIILKRELIAAYQINWDNKADNIQALARQLNIGLDSMVFIDDNPTERHLVSQLLPMVAVPEFPAQPYELPRFFHELVDRYFRIYAITDEDRRKTAQYRANAAREQEKAQFADLTDYLRSLDIHLDIMPMDAFNLQRIAQMTQKTNQFNLTTRRYTDADLQRMASDGCRIWCISVSDRFGDNGITGCIIVRNAGEGQGSDNRAAADIDTLLLSCRILGKGIEQAFVKTILQTLKHDGLKELTATYIPTAKNAQVAEFYDQCGFNLTSEHDGTKHYTLSLDEAQLDTPDYYHINVR